MKKQPIRNPYRSEPASLEYKAWKLGYEAGLYYDDTVLNPFACPISLKNKYAEIYLEAKKIAMLEKSAIPEGPYCYQSKQVCPYLGKNKKQQVQQNGYCRLIRKMDWVDDTLLWDQVKECGINNDD